MPYALRCALILTFALAANGLLRGQDVIYSLVDFMPTWVNPSLTGAYEGTARIGALYRDQSRGFNIDAFQTPGLYVDAPILSLGKKKRSWLGVGGTVLADTKGAAALNDTYLEANAAFHAILNQRRSSRTVVSIGVRGGILQRSADLGNEQIRLNEEYDVNIGGGGLTRLTGLDRQGDPNGTGVDIGFGVSLARQLDDERNFRVGLSAQHLTTPDVNLTGDREGQRQFSMGAQAQYRQLLDDQYLIEPAVYLWWDPQGAVSAQLQAMAGVYLGEEADKLVKFGLGFRAPRQAYPMIGFETGDLRVAAAFDIYTGGQQGAIGLNYDAEGMPAGSSKTFSSAFEIGVSYILKIYKQPKVEPVILCPQI